MKLSHKQFVILLLYGLSGATALAYEVLWTRMLSLFFGVSILGVVVTVAAFMLGLGLGSLLGYRWQGSIKNSLRTFAAIEISVALYALCLPLIMQSIQSLWLPFEYVSSWQLWQLAVSLVVLSVPAIALGFAFPLMLRVGQSCHLSLAKLYGVNTLGGAMGALLPLLLLPWLGWLLSLQCMAALGMTIGLVMFYLSLREKNVIKHRLDQAYQAAWPRFGCLLAYAGMGAGALMLEIAWTRAYGMILLRTEYVLAVILAVFLAGIGLGSLLAKYLPRARALAYLPMLIALTALLALYAFPYINVLGRLFVFENLWQALAYQAALIAICTLPTTLALGAWLPLISQKGEGASLYAANSLGACVGALLAGFVLIPYLGTAQTWLLAALLIMVCAYYWVDHVKRMLYLSALIVVFVVLGWAVQSLPAASKLLAQELPGAIDLYQHEDAISVTHVVEKQNGQRVLLADLQRMDASSDATSVEVQRNQSRLALFLHSQAEQVLFLGLGTGVTASGALAWPKAQLHAVELSAGAVAAAQTYFEQVNGQISEKVEIHDDDARRFLMRTHQRYDVILGDLFHPDQVGRGALLSVQQFERAKLRLNSQGLFVQWLAMNQFDITSMQVILRSFSHVFPNNAVFIDGYRIGLVGFLESDSNQHQSAAKLMKSAPRLESWGGEGGWTWLGRYWGNISVLLAGTQSKQLQGEWNPVVEYALPYMRYKGIGLPNMLAWLIQQRLPFGDGAKFWQVEKQDMQAFKRAWAASSLSLRAQLAALKGRPESGRLQALAYRANPLDRWASFAVADAMFASLSQGLPKGMNEKQALQKILKVRPDHEAALNALLKSAISQQDTVMAEALTQQLHDLNPYARVAK
ncbi:MAG: fused MFS/spermidine synthase [Mariprofundaceae bacterium]